MKKLLIAMLALLVLAGCKDADAKPSVPNKPQPVVEPQPIHVAQSTDELYRLFSQPYYDYEMNIEDATSDIPTKDFNASFSGTNIQVSGYDEADTVKTDGKYLYILSQTDLKIVSADAERSALLSQTSILSEDYDGTETANAMYVQENQVIVITSYYSYAYNEGGSRTDCVVKFYDTTNPASPQLTQTLRQEGYYTDSRLADGKLYLASICRKYSIDETHEQTYLPCLRDGEVPEILPLDRIFVCPDTTADSYTTVSLIDAAAEQRSDTLAFTGGTDAIYMDDSGLYLARVHRNKQQSEPYTEEQYSVVDYSDEIATEIKRVNDDGSKLSLSVEKTVSGKVLNQYSMDVYEGNLRIVTTSDESRYSIYTDEKRGFTNYKPISTTSGNNLFVLDSNLEQISQIQGLAEDERVYSVRLMGNFGYIVTFRETDPLFAIDLSDPKNPIVKSELKVSGVSDYLHMYSEGKLFGLGRSENWNLQAEMFDVTNPTDTKLETQLELDYGWSEALENPRAILVDQAHDLIAFPAENGYLLLHYDGTLSELHFFDFESYSDATRGMLLGDLLYICDPLGVKVLDLNAMQILADLTFGVG